MSERDDGWLPQSAGEWAAGVLLAVMALASMAVVVLAVEALL